MTEAAPPEYCEHATGLHRVDARTRGCGQCEIEGTTWTQLRVCLTCGEVGCCEDSPQAHALAHFQSTGHPMIASLERGERWAWCYPHHRYFEPSPVPRPRRRSWLAALLRRVSRRGLGPRRGVG